MQLEDKAGVVTGAGQGFGRESAMALAAAGAAVVCADIDEEGAKETADMIAARGGQTLALRTDVSVEAEVASAIKECRSKFGGFHYIHNNAGVQLEKPLHETTPDEWDWINAVNLRGVFFGCKQAVLSMLKGNGGSIVNTASALSFAADPYLAAYTATKHGVLGLTRAVGTNPAYAKAGIRCNCICPGDMRTPMIIKYWESTPDPEAARKEMESHYPAGQIGEPSEVANAVVFLVSEASSFMNGSHVIVDGGLLAGVY